MLAMLTFCVRLAWCCQGLGERKRGEGEVPLPLVVTLEQARCGPCS